VQLAFSVAQKKKTSFVYWKSCVNVSFFAEKVVQTNLSAKYFLAVICRSA